MEVPTLIYDSLCWFNNVTNTKSLKNYEEAVQGISSDWKSNYKQMLREYRILPLSLCLQLPDILILKKGMNGGFDHYFVPHHCFRIYPRPLRSDNCLSFKQRKPRSTICNKVSSPGRCL